MRGDRTGKAVRRAATLRVVAPAVSLPALRCALPALAAVLAGCSDANCASGYGLRLRVGETTYAVPAQADAVPHEAPRVRGLIKTNYRKPGLGQYCQSRDVAVIDTLRFGFRPFSPAAAERGNHVAATITRTDAVSPPFRPTALVIATEAIRSVEPTALLVDRAARSARFDLRFRLAGQETQVVPVRCAWATGAPGGERRALMACNAMVVLDGGNTLEIAATPPNNDRHFIGRELLRALRRAEQFKVGM
jgi:hypothetical protein